MKNVVLSLKNIVKEFPTSKKNKTVHAISNVSLDIYENETLALVGESGCGKSTLGKCAIGLIYIKTYIAYRMNFFILF